MRAGSLLDQSDVGLAHYIFVAADGWFGVKLRRNGVFRRNFEMSLAKPP